MLPFRRGDFEIREKQEELKIAPGIYGEWSRYRDWETDEVLQKEVAERLERGDDFVIRLKSSGVPNAAGDDIRRTKVVDANPR